MRDAATTVTLDEVRALCAAALNGARLEPGDLATLLAIDDEGLADEVFAAAREARSARFGDGVFLYGFVYFSTYCRNECAFCYYRADNALSPRYRKTTAEVVAICEGLAASGVDLLDLTLGEDPLIHGEPGYRALLDLVSEVCAATGLPVMVSPGVLPAAALRDLHAAGADFYALYQETHTPGLYARLRVGQAFEARVAARRDARLAGLLVEDGILTGIGDTAADRARSIATMRDEGWEQVRAMTFVPQEGTPLARATAGRRPRRAARHRRAAPRPAGPAHPGVARRRRHPRPRAPARRRRQRRDLDRAADQRSRRGVERGARHRRGSPHGRRRPAAPRAPGTAAGGRRGLSRDARAAAAGGSLGRSTRERRRVRGARRAAVETSA